MSDSSEKTNKGLTSKHSKWELESEKIRKVQISLDFPDTADILLRTLAAREHKAPSSMIREIVGMPSSPPKRARIGVSFNNDELQKLGQRYDIDPSDKAEIRRKLTEEVTSLLVSTESLVPSIETPMTVDTKESDLNGQGQLREANATNDLKMVSDSIYLRFKQALAKRNAKKP